MRKLLGAVLIAALGWSGYWLVGSSTSRSSLERWLEARRVEGWQVEYSDITVRGFPNRFDTTLSNLELTDPETGLSWSAPFFQIFALSYKPNHLIAVWPNRQTIATPHQKISLDTKKMTASLKIKPSANLELDAATIVIEGADMTSDAGWHSRAKTLQTAIRNAPGAQNTYDFAVLADSLVPGQLVRDFIGADSSLPETLEGVKLDVTASFDRPLDIRTIEDSRPDFREIDLKESHATWGELRLRAKGKLSVDQEGFPSGDMHVNARNWREMLKLAVSSGAIPVDLSGAVEMGLEFLAKASGAQTSLDAPLVFSDRRIFLGPIPIAPAPQLNLR